MKRSIQEIIELLVFGLIALLVGTGLLWVVGWAFGGVGYVLKLLAGLIWSLLRFVVPIAVVGAAVYALVRLLQGQRNERAETAASTQGSVSTSDTTGAPRTGSASAGAGASAASTPASPPPAAEATSTKAVEPESQRAAVVEEAVEEEVRDTDVGMGVNDEDRMRARPQPEPKEPLNHAGEGDETSGDESQGGSPERDTDEDARR